MAGNFKRIGFKGKQFRLASEGVGYLRTLFTYLDYCWNKNSRRVV